MNATLLTHELTPGGLPTHGLKLALVERDSGRRQIARCWLSGAGSVLTQQLATTVMIGEMQDMLEAGDHQRVPLAPALWRDALRPPAPPLRGSFCVSLEAGPRFHPRRLGLLRLAPRAASGSRLVLSSPLARPLASISLRFGLERLLGLCVLLPQRGKLLGVCVHQLGTRCCSAPTSACHSSNA
jgi:hypothetical protein